MNTNTILVIVGVIALLALFGGIIFYRQKRPNSKKINNQYSTPILDTYSHDITELAKQGRIDPVIGREEEISHTIQILSRRTKNNPILLGEPGVGKTAIVEGLALKIASGNVPPSLLSKRVLSLDLSGLIAGTKYRGEFEKRMKNIMEEIRRAQRSIILFIDEVQVITESKGAEGAISASDMLKPALARGDLQAIGATTPREYQEYIESDESLERRFQPVPIKEPSVEMTIKILDGLKSTYEKHHNVTITNEAIGAAAILSKKYIIDRFLPDKAIDLIDEGSAKVRLQLSTAPDKIASLKNILLSLEKNYQTEEDTNNQQKIQNEITKTKTEISSLQNLWDDDTMRHKPPLVTVNDIKEIIAGWTGKNISEITES